MTLNRRDFLATSVAAAAAGALARPLRLFAQQPQQAVPVFTPVRRNVGIFTMRGGTIGWLVNSGAVVVVDSQFPAEATACLRGVTERSSGRTLDFLINTHHHGDHSDGNISFKGSTKKVVAHVKADEMMRNPPGLTISPGEHLFPDTTFADAWSADVGDEKVSAKFFGRAHTSGDVAVTFERANVVHMGDLFFKDRHPVVDRAAGATMRGWMNVLDSVVSAHAGDTIYIAGHANTGLPLTGDRPDVIRFRDYLGAVLAFVETQVKAGKSKDEVNAMRDPLKGFEQFGKFGAPGPRDALSCAYEEVTSGA